MCPLPALVLDGVNKFSLSTAQVSTEHGAKVLVVPVSFLLDDHISSILKPCIVLYDILTKC